MGQRPPGARFPAYGRAVENPHRDEAETDAEDAEGVEDVERPVDRFRRSATGAVVSAGLLGLRDALEGRPEKEEVAIVNEAPGAPPARDLEVVIDFDHPERSVAVVRRPEDDNPNDDDGDR
jgi:hypothetical protein